MNRMRTIIFGLIVCTSINGANEKTMTVGSDTSAGCKNTPKLVQRLRITKPGVYENYLIDGTWIDSTLVKIKADNVTLRHCEIRNGMGNGIYVDTKHVLIESCKIHHLLSGTFEKQDDAHGITGHPTDLIIRNCEIYMVSGDGIQFDPSRLPWDRVLIENCTIWAGPLSQDASGFKKGQRPGENAVDTKQNNDNPRSKIIFRNCLMYGWKQPGQIRNMAALNIKNKVSAVIDGCVFRDNEIALRLRGGSETYDGALVTVIDCAVYSSDVAVRIEDGLQNLKIEHLAIGNDVKRKYHMAGGGVGVGYQNTGEYPAPAYTFTLAHGVRQSRLQAERK